MDILLYGLCLHAILLLVALGFVWKSLGNEGSQKFLQILISLLIPIVGPTITIAVLWSDIMKPEKPSARYMGQSIDESPFKNPHL
jgi:hypothetical protein